MLIFNLVVQEWRKSYRSQSFYKNLAVTLMLLLFGLYMAVILLFLGFSLNEILEKNNSQLNPMELFNGAMLYLLLGGLAFRFVMQQLNTFNLSPYQVLPIKRSLLVNFLLLKPLASPINYFLLLVVIPFSIKSVVGYYSVAIAVRFVLSFVFMVWFNSLMTAFLKRKFESSFLSFTFLILTFCGIGALEYFNVFSLFNLSRTLFDIIVLTPYGLIIPLLACGTAFSLNKWFFYQNYYPEKFNVKITPDKINTSELNFLNRFGVVGDLIAVELKLILRHKRTKSLMYTSVFLLFYGLIFYTQKAYQTNHWMLLLVAIYITGFPMVIYGQWVISWDSAHFDSLMTRNIPIRTYLNANYYLMVALCISSFILTTPYFFFRDKVENIVLMHFAAVTFNLGVNVYILLWGAMYKTKRIDLTKSSSMNYQGMTYKNYLIVFPILLLPIIIVGVISSVTTFTIALFSLSIGGFAGILFRQPILKALVYLFNNRKYKLAEGFRSAE